MRNPPMFFTDDEKARHIEDALDAVANGRSLLNYTMSAGLAYRTVYDWLTKDETASSAYARAKEAGTHCLAMECLDIADDSSRDTKTVGSDGNETEVCNTEFVQRAKLRIDTRLRLIGKWNRKDYGEKVTNEHTGEDGGPVELSVTRRILKAD